MADDFDMTLAQAIAEADRRSQAWIDDIFMEDYHDTGLLSWDMV